MTIQWQERADYDQKQDSKNAFIDYICNFVPVQL